MIHKVFTVFDSAAEIYMNPFNFKTQGEAMRWFMDQANDPQSVIAKHPKDYTLFELGTYDDSNGEFQTAVKIGIINALECVERAENAQIGDGSSVFPSAAGANSA